MLLKVEYGALGAPLLVTSELEVLVQKFFTH